MPLIWGNEHDLRQTILDLEPGTRFKSAGVEYDLLYVSEVRARVKQISDVRRPTYLNMSPRTVVDEVTLLASQPHIRLTEPDVPTSRLMLIDDHTLYEPKNYIHERERTRRTDEAHRLFVGTLSALGVLFLMALGVLAVWGLVTIAKRVL
jgi:hypothetical protein